MCVNMHVIYDMRVERQLCVGMKGLKDDRRGTGESNEKKEYFKLSLMCRI